MQIKKKQLGRSVKFDDTIFYYLQRKRGQTSSKGPEFRKQSLNSSLQTIKIGSGCRKVIKVWNCNKTIFYEVLQMHPR